MNIITAFRNKQSGAVKSIFLLLTAFFVLSIQDVIVKLMSSDYALLEIVIIRTLFALPIVFVILRYNGGVVTLKSEHIGLQLVRGLTMFVAYVFFFMALAALPYSTMLVIFFSSPLFITALSVPLLKEVVGWRQWVAVLVGFGGVSLTVLNPIEAEFNPATILAVLAALAYALSIITTRKIKDSASSMTVYTTVVYLLLALVLTPIIAGIFPTTTTITHPSLIFLTKAWTTPLLADIFFIFLTALCWGVGMVLLSAAYRDTAVAVLAPFEYFSIIYGLFFGFFIWQEVPNVATIAGVVLIVGSGLYIIYRERENAGNLQRDFPHEI